MTGDNGGDSPIIDPYGVLISLVIESGDIPWKLMVYYYYFFCFEFAVKMNPDDDQ